MDEIKIDMYSEFKTELHKRGFLKKHCLTMDDPCVHCSPVPAGHKRAVFLIDVPSNKFITIRGDINPPAFPFVLGIKDVHNYHISDKTGVEIYKVDEMGKRKDIISGLYSELSRITSFLQNIQIPAKNILGIDILSPDLTTDPAYCNLFMRADVWTLDADMILANAGGNPENIVADISDYFSRLWKKIRGKRC